MTLAGEPSEYSIDDDPDVLETSVGGGHRVRGLRVGEGDTETDGRPICIAIREWTPAVPRTRTPARRKASVTASAGEYRKVEPATSPGSTTTRSTSTSTATRARSEAGEAFLVDAITVVEGTDTSENTQLVDDATCGA